LSLWKLCALHVLLVLVFSWSSLFWFFYFFLFNSLRNQNTCGQTWGQTIENDNIFLNPSMVICLRLCAEGSAKASNRNSVFFVFFLFVFSFCFFEEFLRNLFLSQNFICKLLSWVLLYWVLLPNLCGIHKLGKFRKRILK
jgi:uncharacterized RDD family membrane protein YckC